MSLLEQTPTNDPALYLAKDRIVTRIDYFKSMVEFSIRTDFSENVSLTKAQRGIRSQLSTDLSQVGPLVASETLRGECGIISSDLGRALKKNGIKTSFVNSHRFQNVGDAIHYFLLIDGDIAVDPTNGQYIEGHNQVFVGTINDLSDLVFTSGREGKFTALAQRLSRNGAEEFFERVWGSKQRIIW